MVWLALVAAQQVAALESAALVVFVDLRLGPYVLPYVTFFETVISL